MKSVDHLPGRRWFGWLLLQSDGRYQINVSHDPLDKATWAEFLTITRVSEQVRLHLIDWLYVQNTADYFSKLQVELSRHHYHGHIIPGEDVELNAALQGTIANALNASHTFRTRADALICKRHGHHSPLHRAFLAAIAFWQKNSFAYRLMSGLGDRLSHRQLPFELIGLDVQLRHLPKAHLSISVDQTEAGLFFPDKPDLAAEIMETPKIGLDLFRLTEEYFGAHQLLMVHILDSCDQEVDRLLQYASILSSALNVPEDAVPVVWEATADEPDPTKARRPIGLGLQHVRAGRALGQKLRSGLQNARGGPSNKPTPPLK